jgi:HlyD family secretion protein
VDESDISRVKVGQSASFTVDAYPEQQFTGTVIQIRNAPVVTSNVVTYVAVIGVSNQELKLKPGMTANVAVQTQKKDDVLKIPSAALRFKPKPGKDEKSAKPAKPEATSGTDTKSGKDAKAGVDAKAVNPAGSEASAQQGKGGYLKGAPNRGGGQKVYLLKADGSPAGVTVGTGISDGSFVELVSGELKENDEVIVEQVAPAKKSGGMGSPMGPRF